MNKTINELVALTELANDDELIVYDVSEGTSKKIKKSDFVTTSIASGNQKPPTSEAVFNKFGKMQVVTGNANDLKTVGFYTGCDLTNAPTTGWVNYIVTCYNDSPNFVKQIAVCARGVYVREAGTTVGNWENILEDNGSPVTINNTDSGIRAVYVRQGNNIDMNVETIPYGSFAGAGTYTITGIPKPVMGTNAGGILLTWGTEIVGYMLLLANSDTITIVYTHPSLTVFNSHISYICVD